MIADNIRAGFNGFNSVDERSSRLESLAMANPKYGFVESIGTSEEGRPLQALRIGKGSKRISLVAGAHSDEPVGPETLYQLALGFLTEPARFSGLFDAFQFYIIPHVNPDGEARNRKWMNTWPSVESYLTTVFREPPGRDIEFSYPERRIENAAVSQWLKANGPFHLHMSLHGMGFSDGAMLLIERNWTYRTELLQKEFTASCKKIGLHMHDHNRKGEKGFFYIGPGFTTTPEGAAMRRYFLSHGKPETASLFGDSSMEYVRTLGGDPLCLVTEMPLFLVNGSTGGARLANYLDFVDERISIARALANGENVDARLNKYGIRPLSVEKAVFLQLRALELGLLTIG